MFPVRPSLSGPSPRCTPAVLALLVVTAGLPTGLQGQAGPDALPAHGEEAPYVVPFLPGPIAIDGTVTDPAWDGIAPLPLVVQHPEYGMDPTERTEIRIAHDGTYLYASCRCYLGDPGALRANSFYRDQWLNDDTFSLFLDTLRDRETGVHLYTNPLGTKFDALIYNDAEPAPEGLPRIAEWDTFWDVETAITEEGWFAEMRIPLSSLQFREEHGRAVMGLVMYRLLNDRNERHIHPALPPRWFRSYYKPSVAREIVLEGVSPVRALHLTPYVLAGAGRSLEILPDGGESPYIRHRRRPREVGLDARRALSSRLTLDLTLNTDFAQVEADDQQINLDRFSLFVPEKRRFFLERGSLFEFPLDGFNRLFHSRRIGLSDQGELLRIYGGGRLVGQAGPWQVGALSTLVEPGDGGRTESLSAARFRRPILNRSSMVGGMVTSRLGRDGERNVAYGADAVLNLVGDEFLSLRWAHTFQEGLTGAPGEAGHLDAYWERRIHQGLSYRGRFTWSGAGFEPALGFLERRDYHRFGDYLQYGWLPDGGSIQRHQLGLRATAFVRGEDGATESLEVGPEWEVEWRDAATAAIGVRRFHEDVQVGFSLGDGVGVPAGAYVFHAAEARYRTRSGRPVRMGLAARAGGFFDGRRWGGTVTPSWNASRHLELSGDYAVDRIRFRGRNEALTTHLVRARLRTAANTRASGSALLQYNSVTDAISANLRFRYHVRDGNDLYLVYNHALDSERLRGGSPVPATDARAFLVKYTYTLSR